MDRNILNDNISNTNDARNFNANAAQNQQANGGAAGYYYAPPGYAPQAGYAVPGQNGFYAAPQAMQKPPKKHKGAMTAVICLLLVGVLLVGALSFSAALILKSRVISAMKELENKQTEQTEQTTQGSYYTEQINEEDRPSADNAPTISINDIPDTDALSTEQIVARVKPCVVGILTYKGQTEKTLTGGGSGIIISEDGYIVTNAHVVSDTTALEVVLDDDTSYSAAIAGIDIRTDLAVIKIDAENLPVAEFGDSDSIQVGGAALAIGNPGGLSNTVTQGIFSAVNREIPIQLADSTTATFSLIQTDAAINPGNSGGALVNKYGQVVGINSAKITSLQYEGLGFAIPINVAKPVIDDLILYGSVTNRVRLGITATAVGGSVIMSDGHDVKGLYIESITDDSPLRNTDITVGDIIVSVDGEKMGKLTDLSAFLAKHKPGDEITIRVYKQQTGKEIEAVVVLSAADE